MKRFFGLLIIFILFGLKIFAQCDSVVVEMLYTTGDYSNGNGKTVVHYNSSGKILSFERYGNDYPTFKWLNQSRELYTYDANDSMLSHTIQNGNDSVWVNSQQTLYSYNLSGQRTSVVYQNWSVNSWYTYNADSSIYDSQNNLISEAGYNPNPVSRKLYFYNAQNLISKFINQSGDSTYTWKNNDRTDNFYNANQDIILEVNFVWNSSSWDTVARTISIYSNTLRDTVISQQLDTTWKNETLTTYDYNGSNQNIRIYYLIWADTAWQNQTSYIYDYGPLNHIIHSYSMTWSDTAWIYNSENINEVDSNGYPSYQNSLTAYYDSNGLLYWESWDGPEYFTYSPTGFLLSYNGHYSPGGPYWGYCVFSGGILSEFHSHYESMGGLTYDGVTYYYYADLLGDSVFCTGQNAVLLTDSCPGYSYQWSNGATTSSISVNTPGTYYVSVTHPNGFIAMSQPVTVTRISSLPYLSTGADSSINLCGSSYVTFYSPQQLNVNYQWYRNDTVLDSQVNSSLLLYGSYVADGKYYLVATNACGSDTSAKSLIHLLPYPAVPTITPGYQFSFCQGDSVTLTSSPGYRYSWSPGNDTTQSKRIGSSGSFEVFVYDSSGCSNHSSFANTVVNQYPSRPNIFINNDTLRTNYGGTLQWMLNGDSIAGATGNYCVPVLPGYYKLALSNYYPCCSYSDSIYINPGILNVNIPSIQYVCDHGSTYIGGTLPLLGGTPPYSFHWYPNLNLISSGPGQAHLTNMTNDAVYYLTVTDFNGLTATDSVQVFIDYPTPHLITYNTSRCMGNYNSIRINNNGTNFNIFKWIVNGDTSTSTNTFYSLYTTGIYQAIITDQYGCQASTPPDTIIMFPGPSIPLIHAVLDSNACINGNGTLWVNSRPGENYKWYRNPPSNFLLSSDTLVHADIPYQYTLNVTDSNNCTATTIFNFDLLNESITIPVNADNFSLCDTGTVHLTAADISGWTYSWFFNSVLQNESTNIYDASLPGTYECVATSPAGCTASGTNYIYQNTAPVVSINLTNGTLTSTAPSYVSYQWFLDGLEISGAILNSYVPNIPGNYFVRIKLWPGYGSPCYGYSNLIYFDLCSVNILPVDSMVCWGQCNGVLKAVGQGTGLLSYHWSDSVNTQVDNNLCAGLYSVTITDSVGCMASSSTSIIEDTLSFTLNKINPSCAGCNNGTIGIIVQQGVSPFSYSWLPATGMLAGNIIDSLTAGIYQICVADRLSCMVCENDTLTDLPLYINSTDATSILYFPNPVDNELTILGWKPPLIGNFQAKIYNNFGQLIKTVDTHFNHLNVSELPPGIYIIELPGDKIFYRLRFVKD